jgi:acyl transferase domain-containing protein
VTSTTSASDIAIIGMAGRFPGAANMAEFWDNVQCGVETISFFSAEELAAAGVDAAQLENPNYVPAKGVVEDAELFDAAFFGFSAREAEIMDPQHRLFLECAWEALESAGYSSESSTRRVGVFGGASTSTYLWRNLLTNPGLMETVGGFQAVIGNDRDHLTTLVSYKLNLRGPSLTLQTACSTSLVAVHVACQSLLNGESDLALAGGVSLGFPRRTGYVYQDGGIMSPDGHCRAFDADARGTVCGEGVGIVVLKRLAEALDDGDTIYAVVKSSAINNDGSQKVGYTAPSIDGQAEVIAEALALADIDPDTIGYIEAHGTGTPLGDPIEIAALTQVFGERTEASSRCALGSVKTNVGHLDTAAGVTGLIKAALAVRDGVLPPSLHFSQPNPRTKLNDGPFYVNARLSPWAADASPRRAGVSSFGIGGTNAHVILEQAPASTSTAAARRHHLLALSARSSTALDAMTARLAEHLTRWPETDLADVAYTLQVGRCAFAHRRVVICTDRDDAVASLESNAGRRWLDGRMDSSDRPVAFMFPGQGSQYVDMAAGLYQSEPVFRQHLDHCAELLRPHLADDLRSVIYPGTERAEWAATQLVRTELAQPALFAVEYALAQLWMSFGVQPAAMIGHSIGEYVAACLAGVLSLEDALALVAARGRLMQALPPGGMLAVPMSEADLRPLLEGHLSIAAVNAPELSVVSGPPDAVESVGQRLAERGIEARRLHTSHAFHSSMVEPILEEFTETVRRLQLGAPSLPYISNVTGTWITQRDVEDPSYWARHLRQTVRFADGLRDLLADPGRLLLEVGPGRTLSALVSAQHQSAADHIALTTLRHPLDRQSDDAFLLTTLGRLWLSGAPIDWPSTHGSEQRRRVPLPSYPFERQRYFIEPGATSTPVTSHAESDVARVEELDLPAPDGAESTLGALARHPRPVLANPYAAPSNDVERAVAEIWQEFLGIGEIGIDDGFFELGGHSLLATQITSRLRQAFEVDFPLSSFFAAPTIAGQALALSQRQLEEADADTLTEILAEIDASVAHALE